MIVRSFVGGSVMVLVSTFTLLSVPHITEEEIFQNDASAVALEDTKKQQETVTLLFVGDVMLGRKVEWYMDTHANSYPFERVTEFLQEADITVGNFEGVVSPEHIPTPSMTYQFSIKKEYLAYLETIGFDILSLGNNHSLDYGTSSLAYTRSLCTSYGLACVGTPKQIDAFSSHVMEVKGKQIGFLSLETINGMPQRDTLKSTLTELASTTDTQIVLIHWGTEYMLTHTPMQEELGHFMIDAGADVIIGHHPHVIEDVELYKEKPIFYSLGNFIFDQYFSADVQEELAVEMSVGDTDITYTLIPFSSTTTQSQPNFMTDSQKKILFKRILRPLVLSPEVDLEKGMIVVQRD